MQEDILVNYSPAIIKSLAPDKFACSDTVQKRVLGSLNITASFQWPKVAAAVS